MAKAIKGNEIIVDNALANAIADAKNLTVAYDTLDKSIAKIKVNIKGMLSGVSGKSVAEIKALNAALKLSNDLVAASIDLDKRKISALAEEEKLKQQQIKTERESIKLAKDKAAADKRALDAEQKLNSEYQKQSTRLNELRKSYKDLILVQGQETAETRKMLTEITKLDAKLKAVDARTGQHQRSVGNYQKALGGLNNSLMQLGIGFSVFSTLNNVMTTVVNFEKATASLSAITGATGNDLKALKGTILDMATEMKVSVTETTKLFEIVGSQMPQLLSDTQGMKAVAESAIILSKASGDTVEASTLAMASAMNQFNLGADQAERVMNVLAAGSLVGSAGITDVSDAMKNFGSVAAGANISVEESVALIEVLGKFGVVGAESGTKLRGSILKLQQANFGYASGQFEVNDALTEAKAKFDTLGTAMEKDAFLQKTFGAENIATGRILLSNIGLFEEYTKGVTGTSVATEQAAINSDTMSTVIKELKAAWENLVIKWSEGTGTLDGLKTILRFVAENLESIIGWVFKAVSVWASYTLATKLWNKEGTGMIQVLKNMFAPIQKTGEAVENLDKKTKSVKIGFAGWIGILVALLPYLIEAGKEIYQLFDRTTSLEKVTEKLNTRMQEEQAKLDLVGAKVRAAWGDKKKMGELMTEINDTYGTTLQNLDDETAMMNQLAQAYKDVNKEMAIRISKQLIEEELVDAFRRKREAEKFLNESGMSWLDIASGSFIGKGFAGKDLEDAISDINSLQKQMFELNNITGEVGKTYSNLGRKVFTKTSESITDTTEKVIELTKAEKDLLEIEKEMADVRKIGGQGDIDRLEGGLSEPVDKSEPWQATYGGVLKETYDKIAEEEKAAQERRKKLAQETIDLMKKITDALVSEIDKRIAKEEEQLSESEKREDYFRELAAQGNTDAAESVKAEQIAQAKQQLEIEALEKKKRDLLVLVTTLELASQKINSGDSNAMSNAGSEMANLIAKIPKFYEGTEGTVAEALGRPHLNTSKDGYLARVHGNEMIHGAEQSAKLQSAGFASTSDIANAALAYHSNIAGSRSNYQSTNSDKIVSKLDAVEQAIKSIDIPEHNFAWDEQNKMGVHTIKTHNKIVKNHFKTDGLFS